MRALAPAWPPNERASHTATLSPSDAAYTAVDSPAGPLPTTATSYTLSWATPRIMPIARASSVSLGLRSTVPSGATTSGQSVGDGE